MSNTLKVMKAFRYIIAGLLILNLSGAMFAFESCLCIGDKGVCTFTLENSYTHKGGRSCCVPENQENTSCRDSNSPYQIAKQLIFLKNNSIEKHCKSFCLLCDDPYINKKSQKITLPKTENTYNVRLINETTIYTIDSYQKLGLLSYYSPHSTLRIYLQTSALLI